MHLLEQISRIGQLPCPSMLRERAWVGVIFSMYHFFGQIDLFNVPFLWLFHLCVGWWESCCDAVGKPLRKKGFKAS